MVSTSETGHVRNISHFLALISYCETLGSAYNPGASALALPALWATYNAAKAADETLLEATAAHSKTTNARRTLFSTLNSLSTRIYSALAACGAHPLTLNDARYLVAKIRADRRKTRPTPNDDGTEPRTISTSQQSYVNRTGNFSRLVLLVSDQPLYTPNEPELTPTGLQTHLQQLTASTDAVFVSSVAYQNALDTRNHTLYGPGTGILAMAARVKRYIKSVYGAASPEYKYVSGLHFRK